MTEERLQSFYDEKYMGAGLAAPALIRQTAWPRTRDEAVVSAVGPGRHYLEIGAGSGAVAVTIRDRFETLTVVELSTPRGDVLGRVFSADPNVRTILHDVEQGADPFVDRRYDTVVMNAVIEHLVDPIGTLETLLGVMSDGGQLLITTPNIAKWTRRLKLLAGRFPSTASVDEGLERYEGGPTALYDEGHLHYFTYRSLRRVLLERVGFAHVDALWFGTPPLLARFVPLLFSDVFVRAVK